MTIYFKSASGASLVKLGNILTIGGSKKNSLLTGNEIANLVKISEYSSEEETQKILDDIINKITHPTAKELEKGVIYIVL